MKKLILISIFILSISVVKSQSDKHEYMTITFSNNYIVISNPDEEPEAIKINDEKSGTFYDFNPLLTRVEKYEELGWQYLSFAVNNHTQGYPGYVVLMRKPKSE